MLKLSQILLFFVIIIYTKCLLAHSLTENHMKREIHFCFLVDIKKLTPHWKTSGLRSRTYSYCKIHFRNHSKKKYLSQFRVSWTTFKIIFWKNLNTKSFHKKEIQCLFWRREAHLVVADNFERLDIYKKFEREKKKNILNTKWIVLKEPISLKMFKAVVNHAVLVKFSVKSVLISLTNFICKVNYMMWVHIFPLSFVNYEWVYLSIKFRINVWVVSINLLIVYIFPIIITVFFSN